MGEKLGWPKQLFWHPQVIFFLFWKLTGYNFKRESKEVWTNLNVSKKLGCCQNILSSRQICFVLFWLFSEEKLKQGINCLYLCFLHMKISNLQQMLESPVNATSCDLMWLTHIRSSGFWLAEAAVGVLASPQCKHPELSREIWLRSHTQSCPPLQYFPLQPYACATRTAVIWTCAFSDKIEGFN